MTSITPQEALHKLIEGNQRYAKNESLHPNRCLERRQEVVAKQTPFATIIGCSDSRVPLEIIFDVGLGDLFAIRLAGNVVAKSALESILFSLTLNSKLIVVLGHENCGALQAFLAGKGSEMPTIASLIEPIQSTSLEQAIKENAIKAAKELQKQPKIAEMIQHEQLLVKPAYYRLESGEVELL